MLNEEGLWIALYGSIAIVMYIFLTINVIKKRRSMRVPVGDGGDRDMLYIIRAQGNFAEHTPMVFVLMLFGVKLGMPIFLLNIVGVAFILGRISHAYSLTCRERKRAADYEFRVVGMLLTFTAYLIFLGFFVYSITLSLIEYLK